MNKLKKISGAAVILLAAFACENQDANQNLTALDDSPLFRELQRPHGSARTAEEGKYAVFSAEYITSDESGQIGRTIYFTNVGNKQLTADFVPGYSIDGSDNISYYVDQNRPSADLPVASTSAALVRAMNTWDGVTCSNLGLTQVPSNSMINTGYVSALLGFGGSYGYIADVVHAGWLPKAFFDAIAADGSTYILGVTFTITFTENGQPTDLDNNGKADVAWREIYYNDTFAWNIGNHYDVETIALHEAGHGLSQAHFGAAFASPGNNKLHFSPRAVMNAAYSGVQTQIGQTDNAGHCSNWASWANN